MRTFLLIAVIAASFRAFAEQRLELVRHSLTGTHCRYREYVDGIPSDVFEMRACDVAKIGIASVAQPLREETPFRIIDGRVAQRIIVEDQPLERVAYDYDVESGALIRTVPLFFHAKAARVFDPNPVVALNDPTLQDRNDSAAAVPASAYRDVELQDVVANGPLAGPFVKLVDRQSPNIAPPDASASLLFDRAADGFEDVNVYFHVDRSQRHLQALGYVGARGVAAYAIEADAHSLSGTDNSLFLPSSSRFGEGTLHFGEGGTDDAEDADLVVHEYGHAIQEWISPGTFGGTFTSESRALSEGLSDYWAYSTHVAQRLATGRDPFCFADWDARCWEDDASQQCGYRPGADCLRRLDSALTMAEYERSGGSGAEHRNGAIWSSALREIHQQLGRDVTDTIVVESMFDVPPHPTFAVMAQRMIEADRLLFNAVHAQTICVAMLNRGIVTGCDATYPRGAETVYQSSDRSLPIPESSSAGVTSTLMINDAHPIERLFVRVDITHPVRGDLRIELVAPDGTTILLQQASFERGADVHATFGVTAQSAESLDVLHGMPAFGVWKLVVHDTRALDSGTLLSWGLLVDYGTGPIETRPGSFRTQVIPVVAHVFGVGASRFVTDVRIANPSPLEVSSIIVFTRSGEDGTKNFLTTTLHVDAGQTIAFDDIVDSVLHTVGSGSLTVLGDVLVMSRTYAETRAGTLGEQVPPVRDTTAVGERPLALAPLPEAGSRYNIGVTETAGQAGAVMVGDRRIEVLPFSHVQFSGDSRFAIVRVVEGEARVAAYVSQVNAIGDPMFIPAETLSDESRELVAPAISVDRWRTDFWVSSDKGVRVNLDPLGKGSGLQWGVLDTIAKANELAGSRIHNSNGTDQFVPFAGFPKHENGQSLLFIETTPPYRTNIGIYNYYFREARAEVIVYDAAGTEVQRETLQTVNGIAQMPVLPRITGGRALVVFLDGLDLGPGYAYASLVDSRTGDATYVQGQ